MGLGASEATCSIERSTRGYVPLLGVDVYPQSVVRQRRQETDQAIATGDGSGGVGLLMNEASELLPGAIAILDGIDVATKDNRGETRRAIGVLDRLITLMEKNQDTTVYPAGLVGRIREAREALNEGGGDHGLIAGAQRILKAVLRDWNNSQEQDGS